jgi:hypothetical protein
MKARLDRIVKLFDNSIKVSFKLEGNVRPGEQKGNEQ